MAKTPFPRLILASSSPYRRQQLENLGLPFTAVAPRFDEDLTLESDPAKLALHLARGKAMSVAPDFPDAIIIGSDQVIWFDGHILAKPGTKQRALAELKQLRSGSHDFFMGLFLHHTGINESQEFSVKGSARLRADLSDEELSRYVELDNPIDCAGSAKTEGPGLMLFERLDCEDWSAIIGLPIIALTTGLRRWGFPLFPPQA